MKDKPRVVVIMPAYNAALTLGKTYKDIPKEYINEIILGDDCSSDDTAKIAERLGLTILRNKRNMGYGSNQKMCYSEALKRGADIVVMIHPDYQYDATKVHELIEPIKNGGADAVFGSRILGQGAIKGGMPLYKYIANKFLTFCENLVLGYGLSEYHTGLRAYSRRVLEVVPWRGFSDGFVFDTEIIVQMRVYGFKIKEIPIETRYFKEASEVGFFAGCVYGILTLYALAKYLWGRMLKCKVSGEKLRKI